MNICAVAWLFGSVVVWICCYVFVILCNRKYVWFYEYAVS